MNGARSLLAGRPCLAGLFILPQPLGQPHQALGVVKQGVGLLAVDERVLAPAPERAECQLRVAGRALQRPGLAGRLVHPRPPYFPARRRQITAAPSKAG